MAQQKKRQFVICVDNHGYTASLEPRKIYESVPDTMAEKHNQIRVIDESGEDYLFPLSFFLPVELPENIERAIKLAA